MLKRKEFDYVYDRRELFLRLGSSLPPIKCTKILTSPRRQVGLQSFNHLICIRTKKAKLFVFTYSLVKVKEIVNNKGLIPILVNSEFL